MPRLFESLWLVLATAGDRKLAQTVEYLKAENSILRAKLPKRITLTDREKNRLVKFGSKLGPAIWSVISIVSPRTFLRWVKGDVRTGESKDETKARPGRPKTDNEVRELILRFAKENGWGYTRIHGELKKLGVGSVSRSTVVNILKANGFDPGPTRGKGTWSEFIERHAKTLWASDFLQVQTMTTKGIVDLFVLFFIQPRTKRAIVSGITANPDSAWVTQQARNVTMEIADLGFPTPEVLIIDHDSKFTKEFDTIWSAEGTSVKRVGPFAPNLNAFAERFAQTLRHECLDHFLILGEKHLRHLLKEFLEHYHEERPHQSLDNRPPNQSAGPEEVAVIPFVKEPKPAKVVCRERFGGLLKSYSCAAA
jgi:putative transposase